MRVDHQAFGTRSRSGATEQRAGRTRTGATQRAGPRRDALQRVAQLQSEHAAKIAELEADAETRDQEMTVLMAHLKEARRPIETIEDDVKRLKDDLALKPWPSMI